MTSKISFMMTRARRFRLAGFAVLLSAASVRCSGGEKIGPPPAPAAIQIAGGDSQVAPVDAPLPQPLVVVVTDEAGDPVEGIAVQWDAHGTGEVSPATVATGID